MAHTILFACTPTMHLVTERSTSHTNRTDRCSQEGGPRVQCGLLNGVVAVQLLLGGGGG
jgi:hypothetical protein